MGIVLAPFLIGVIIIFIKAIFQLFTLIQGNEFPSQAIFIGILIPILLIVFKFIHWIKIKKVYAFQPHFFLPSVLIYLPMMICLSMKNVFNFHSPILMHSILLTWIVFSGIILVPLFLYGIKFLKKNGVIFYY